MAKKNTLLIIILMLWANIASGFALSDLKGVWTTKDGNIIAIKKVGQQWRGVIEHATAGAKQIGYRPGQLVMKDFELLEDSGFKASYAVRSINPITAGKCQAEFVEFTGDIVTHDDGKTVVVGQHQEIDFELPWNPGEPCETNIIDNGWVLADLHRESDRNFMLRNLQVSGMYHCQHPDYDAPYAPYSDISVDGHFRVFLPKGFYPKTGSSEYQRREDVVSAHMSYKDPNGNWRNIGSNTAVKLPRCKQPTYLDGMGHREAADDSFVMSLVLEDSFAFDPEARFYPAWMDDTISTFWEQLNQGSRNRRFRIQISANATGDEDALTVTSPSFSKDQMLTALEQRLDYMSNQLLRMSLDRFDQEFAKSDGSQNETDYDAPKGRLWYGFYIAASHLYADVEVHNLMESSDRHTATLLLQATFNDGSNAEIGRQEMLLGSLGIDETHANNIDSRSIGKISFIANELPNRRFTLNNLMNMTGVRVVTEPQWAGPIGNGTIAQITDPAQLANIKRFVEFSARMRQVAGGPVGLTSADRYASLAGQRNAGERPWMEYAYQSVNNFLNQRYAEFVRLHRIYMQFKLATGGTVLDQLDSYVRSKYTGNRSLYYRNPNEGPSFTTTNGSSRPELRPRVFELSQSRTNIGASFISALLNPQLSFRIDPALLPLNQANLNESSRRAYIPGVNGWVYAKSTRVDTDFALRQFDANPDMQDAYRQLTGSRGSHARLSTELAQNIRTGEFEGTKGRVFEEVMIKPRLMQDAVALGEMRDRGTGQKLFTKILVLDGTQIYAEGIRSRKTSSGELTDGMVLGFRNNQWHILSIAEAKSGVSGANDLFDQYNKDVFRLQNSRIRLQKLTPQQQQILGITSRRHVFQPVGDAGGLVADFNNPYLYQSFVVSDADIKLPRPKANEPQHTRMIRFALENNVRRSRMTQENVESITDILFKQAGIKPTAWHERNLDYANFIRITRRSLRGQDMPPQDELDRKFANGERFNPETKRWQRVFDAWEQPVRSVDQIVQDAVAFYKTRHNGQEPDDTIKARYRANAEAGKRFNPTTQNGSWPGVGTLQKEYRAFIIHPNDVSLSQDELRVWLKHSGKIPASQHDMFIQRFSQGDAAYNMETGQWERYSTKEREKRQRMRNLIAHNPNYASAYMDRIATANAAGDVAERVAMALGETSRIARERLRVYVYYDDQGVYINVIPEVIFQNGQSQRLSLPPSIEKGLLQRYYRYSQNMFWEAELPPWLN